MENEIIKLKNHTCRIKAYEHATLKSYKYQVMVIKSGMGAPKTDYAKKRANIDDITDLVLGLMAIELKEDNSGADNSGADKGGRKKLRHKGGIAMNFDITDNGQRYIDHNYDLQPITEDYRLYDLPKMYQELFEKVDGYKTMLDAKSRSPLQNQELEKIQFLLAEINICKDRAPHWPELEALYRYDVLDYTFAYSRAQYGYEEGVQDEDGLYVNLLDNNPRDNACLLYTSDAADE